MGRLIVMVSLLLMTLNVSAQRASPLTWESLEIGRTTEERIVYLFGLPDYVRFDMAWPEYEAFQRTPRMLRFACLTYAPMRDDLPLLNGPLGRASDASICVENGTLAQIEWDYKGDAAKTAFLRWLEDKSAKIGVYNRVVVGSEPVTNGKLTFTCPNAEAGSPACAGDVQVMLARNNEGQ